MIRSRFYSIISVPVFGILYCYTALLVFFFLLCALLKLEKIKIKLSQIWARGIFIIMLKRFRIKGKENIDKDRKYILVANHSSFFDITAIMSFYPEAAFFGHERLLKIPVFGRVLKILNYVPFITPSIKNTKEMLQQLELNIKKHTVVIFPEGTRTLNGQINNFYKGFIYLFRSGESEILPVTLNGFFKLKPKNRSYIHFDSELEIIIHKPVSRIDLDGKTDNEIINSIKSVIESAYQ